MSAPRREVVFTPAFDKRNKDPKKNYGVHGVDLRMCLHGEAGTVQFVVFTNWHLPHVRDELNARFTPDRAWLKDPIAADLGYHSKRPLYDGQEPMGGECSVIGCACYYDGSGLNAEPVLDLLIHEGSDAVWKRLEAYYADVFGDNA
jgi:hypothetical protein